MTNLLLPVKGQFGSLWTNRIISQISIEEALERFSTYAKVIGWSEKQFLTFMMPGIKSFNYSEVMYDISGSKAVPGLGYWLTFHNYSMDTDELRDLSAQLTRIYNSIDYIEKLKEYKVKRIVLNSQSLDDFNKLSKKVGNYIIIDLD